MVMLKIELKSDDLRRMEARARSLGYDSVEAYLVSLADADIKTHGSAKETLDRILATYPDDEVIAQIEAPDPPWKHDLLPWRIARPGEPIPPGRPSTCSNQAAARRHSPGRNSALPN